MLTGITNRDAIAGPSTQTLNGRQNETVHRFADMPRTNGRLRSPNRQNDRRKEDEGTADSLATSFR